VREHACHLTGDPAADRLLEFAGELDARADTMDELRPYGTVVAHSRRVGCRWSADATLIDSRLLCVARPNNGLNGDQAAALISPNISDRSCNRAR
jgi:hypothetical protein